MEIVLHVHARCPRHRAGPWEGMCPHVSSFCFFCHYLWTPEAAPLSAEQSDVLPLRQAYVWWLGGYAGVNMAAFFQSKAPKMLGSV